MLTKTRYKSYRDYGFEAGEETELKRHCRSPDLDAHGKFLIKQAAYKANPDLAEFLFESLTENLSYEDLCYKKYVPIGKVDFYAYQRKTLYYYKNFIALGV